MDESIKAQPSPEIVVVISDCHLSGGRYVEGKFNPHEDFHFDRDMEDFFRYFSEGRYGEGCSVELVLNGDFLDFLNVPYLGEFEEAITEQIALAKWSQIFKGHPRVMSALKRFASLPKKKITYLVGNHDAELFFPKVSEAITRAWDPEGCFPSDKVQVVTHTDRLIYPGGLEIHHGNQFEESNQLDFNRPFHESPSGEKLLNIPWGSIYVMKIVNRLKAERQNLDKIRPFKVFVLMGLLFDFFFTLKFLSLSTFYFVRTRLQSLRDRQALGFWKSIKILNQETGNFFLDLEAQARGVLAANPTTKTIIFGHTHLPMHRVYEDGRQYINTGTWTKMVMLDWRYIGEPSRRTFALARKLDQGWDAELHQWNGSGQPYAPYLG